MAPRGRLPKPRTSRMDAAIDAMKPFGFTEEVVMAKMRQLLKEYDGQYGFIELDAYSVLLEALITDQDIGHHHQQNQQEVALGETSNSNAIVEGEKVEDGHSIVPTDGFIDIPVCSSTTLTVLPPPPPPPVPPPPPPPPQSPPPPPPPPPPVQDAVLLPLPPVLSAVLTPPENDKPRRRKAFHGWVCDDEEELQFIILPSSFNGQISPETQPETPHQQAQPELTRGRKNRSRRRSRWDLRPEDI